MKTLFATYLFTFLNVLVPADAFSAIPKGDRTLHMVMEKRGLDSKVADTKLSRLSIQKAGSISESRLSPPLHVSTLNRRDLVNSLFSFSVITSSVTFGSNASNAVEDVAVETKSETPPAPAPETRYTTSQIQNFLQPIPTFTIVDKTGTPYMVVGEDAKLTAYFFTSYTEADRILKSANQSTIKTLKEAIKEENAERKTNGLKPMTQPEIEDSVGINPWADARVSTVPLDFAVGLANRGKIKGSYFRIAPAEDDVQDAIAIDKIDDLAEGKVPLFYFEDFEQDLDKGSARGGDGGSETETTWSRNPDIQKKIPLYFSKGQLLSDWKQSNPKANKDSIPEVKVTELFSLLTSIVRAVDVDIDLEKLSLTAPVESEKKAKICEKKGGYEKPFKLGERLVIL